MFRKLEKIAKINPEMAEIRKESKCHSDRVFGYIELIFKKATWLNQETKNYALEIYKNMRSDLRLTDQDPRKMAGGIVYYAAVIEGSYIRREDIIEILKPMSKVTITKGYEAVKLFVN